MGGPTNKICTSPRPWERISEARVKRNGGDLKDHEEILAKIKLRHDFKESIRRMRGRTYEGDL